MALGVIGDVHKQPAQCRGQLIAADVPLCKEIRFRQKTNSGGTTTQGGVKFIEEFCAACDRRQFRLQQSELIRVKRLAFGIGEQPIETSGNVAQMERDWGDSERALIEFEVGQSSCPAIQIFPSQLQCVQHGSRNSRDFV